MYAYKTTINVHHTHIATTVSKFPHLFTGQGCMKAAYHVDLRPNLPKLKQSVQCEQLILPSVEQTLVQLPYFQR